MPTAAEALISALLVCLCVCVCVRACVRACVCTIVVRRNVRRQFPPCRRLRLQGGALVVLPGMLVPNNVITICFNFYADCAGYGGQAAYRRIRSGGRSATAAQRVCVPWPHPACSWARVRPNMSINPDRHRDRKRGKDCGRDRDRADRQTATDRVQ